MRGILTCLFVGIAVAPAVAASDPNYDDATLRAVHFVDRNEGWAAGDLGVIWHTIDGGKTWERQPSGTRASLRGIQFLTPYTGWVVGRIELPNGAGSSGIVLFTADGGATWKEHNTTSLPGLNAVQFLDENKGVVAGDGTGAFPSGALTTTDGGRTWAMIPGPKITAWNAAQFQDLTTGTLWGSPTLGLVKSGKIEDTETKQNLPATGRTVVRTGNDLVLVGGWFNELPVCMLNAVVPERASLPVGLTHRCELRGVAANGPNVWAVGSPGSMVTRSADFGKTWTTSPTGGTVPLHAICMTDATTGWAVGDLGTIRHTTDGGQTWSLQKAGAQKAAVLFVHAHSESVPFAAIAQLSAKDGYICVVHGTTAHDNTRLAAAVSLVGGSVGEGFDSIVHFDDAIRDYTLDRLVLAIRTWKPDVIVTDRTGTSATTDMRKTVAHVKEAVALAADPTKFPDHIQKLGLAAHEVKKLYGQVSELKAGVVIETTAFRPELLSSAKEFAEPATMLVGAKTPERLQFELLSSRTPGAESHKLLVEGISLAEGGTARRKGASIAAAPEVVSAREAASGVRRSLDQLAATGDVEKCLPELVAGIAKLPAESAARAAIALAQTLAERGQWSAAREVYAFAAEHMPTHPESVDAIRWLIRYHTSSEVRRRIELGHGPVFQKNAFAAAAPSGIQQVGHSELGTVSPKVKFATADALKQWHQLGLNLETKLASFGGAYARDPGTNLCLVAARRNLGLYADANRQLELLVNKEFANANDYQGRMADEARLMTSPTAAVAGTPLAECRFTADRPTLDGKLDEAFWQKCPQLPVKVPVGDYATETRFAFDDKFLYVGVKCSHSEGKAVPKAQDRGRDADVTGHDRVEIYLDLDRDYQTYYRLRVDHRGCVAEDCWGDATWNPKWFVAFDSGPTAWTAEMAIPIAELTGQAVANGHVWAMDVQRIVPGVRSDSWGSPEETRPTAASMGLMKFVK